MASRVSGRPTDAVEAMTRKLVQSASSRPPPNAVLLMAEIVGTGRVERRVKVARRVFRKSRVLDVLWSVSQPVTQPVTQPASQSAVVGWGGLQRHGILILGEGQALLQVCASTKSIVTLRGED